MVLLPHVVNIPPSHTCNGQMQRKTDTFWIKKYEIIYFWFFIPYCQPHRSRGLKVLHRKHGSHWHWDPGGWLFYHVGNLGNPGIWKNIISGISWCIWNLLVLLCIHPWNWFIKAIKDLVGLNLQKPSEFTPQNCKWICCHYYELLWHKHLKPLLQFFILHCFSLPAPCFENSFQPNSKEG